MEAFSLLKYWRGGGGVFTRDTPSNTRNTIVTAVTPSSSDSDNDNDDGPFFDLEFTLPDESDSEDQIKEQDVNKLVVQGSENVNIEKESAEDENEGDDEIKFTLSSNSASASASADSSDPNNATPSSPSDDLFFKGSFIPIDSAASEAIPKFPVSYILRSATKFRVQMLKFKKSKSNLRQKDKPSKSQPNETAPSTSSPPKSQQKIDQQQKREEVGPQDPKPTSKFLTVKLKVEEVMPLVSLLFTKDHNNSSNSKDTCSNSKASSKQNGSINNSTNTDVENTEEEKKFSKDVAMHKYFKKVKPLYVRVSKRYGDKLRFSGQLSFPKSTADTEKQAVSGGTTATEEGAGEAGQVVAVNNNVKSEKQGNLQAGLRVVGKHLGKSRSASASVVATEASRRRDDSLLQQQDGIQSAILHCKTSFNASRGN